MHHGPFHIKYTLLNYSSLSLLSTSKGKAHLFRDPLVDLDKIDCKDVLLLGVLFVHHVLAQILSISHSIVFPIIGVHTSITPTVNLEKYAYPM